MDGWAVVGHSSGSCVANVLRGSKSYAGFSKCLCEPLVKMLHHGVRSILCLEIIQMPSTILFVS